MLVRDIHSFRARSVSGGRMPSPDGFDAMANACIATHEQIARYGSPEMQVASRILLLALADEILRREQNEADTAEDQ
jgi:hypothetical protein